MSNYTDIVFRDADLFIKSHTSLFETELRSIAALKDRIRVSIPNPGDVKEIGDIAGGMGQNVWHLRETFPNAHMSVIDIHPAQIDAANALYVRRGIQDRFHATVGDVYALPEHAYDVTIFWNTLFVIEDWKRAMQELIKATKPGGHLFLATLLNPHDVDLHCEFIDYSRPSAQSGMTMVYNTYSQKRFEEYCRSLGVSKVECKPFEIDIDLPDNHVGIGTYTQKLEDGKRIQISGGMLMNWSIVEIVV